MRTKPEISTARKQYLEGRNLPKTIGKGPECEVIRLNELLFNKNPHLVPSRLGMCISNDESHKLFKFTLTARIVWPEDDPIDSHRSELALSPVLNDTQNYVRQARYRRTARIARTPWTVDTRVISVISPETMAVRTVHSIHLGC
jgi:hypothetical protein